MSPVINKVVQSSSIHNDKIIIGNTTRCVDNSCTGWYSDSFIGKYWVGCKDPKHSIKNGEKEVVGNHPHDLTHQPGYKQPQPRPDTKARKVCRSRI